MPLLILLFAATAALVAPESALVKEASTSGAASRVPLPHPILAAYRDHPRG